MKVGTGRKVRSGEDVAVLTIGPIGNNALGACERLEEQGVSAALYDMRFAKPIDETLLHEVFSKFKHVITVEDGCIQGGMGSAVLEFMADNGYQASVKRLGIPDRYIEHGTQDELYAECGYDADAIVAAALEMTESMRGGRSIATNF
jgi:1-deoxy-D-xylulose-5-phosphate synthase